MPEGPSTALGIGSGLARGLAAAYGQKRERDFITQRDKAARDSQIGASVLGHLIESGRIGNYDELVPYVDLALGTTGQKPKKGELTHHDILSQVLSPTFSEAGAATASSGGTPPGGSAPAAAPAAGVSATPADAAVVRGMAQPRASATTIDQPGAAAVSPTTAAGAPTSAPARRPGLKILTDAEMVERKLSSEETLARGQMERQSKMAREFYDTFKSVDPDFSLYDALAMAGFRTDYNRQYSAGGMGILRGLDAYIANKGASLGRALTPEEQLTARAEWFAQNRSGGVDREAIARADYGLAFAQLSPQQAEQVVRKAVALAGQTSYSRTAGTEQAQFNAPIDIPTAMSSSLPPGTTAASVAGQDVLTQPEIDTRRSTETLRDTLTDIRDRLIPAALPKKDDLGGLAPGAAYALRRRSPETREAIAALESKVNNVVNVMARAVGQQRGTQTEQDALRAEAAIVQMRDALLTGDTVESATVRINESLGVLENILKRLPTQATPQGGGGGRPQAGAARGTPALRARARAALQAAGKQTDDATISRFLELNPNFR